ncbi:MAG TPA: ABC-type transport auxiliary lipoprotein family protein [Burkholderiales bacterium]|nr:ABC-type transport auxiliary lipoprotein family protein [Burkholderiales bacterium]
MKPGMAWRWRGAIRTLLGAALLLAGAGCALQTTRDQPATYDFGPPPAQHATARVPAAVLIVPVSAPSWLDSNAIVYRLNYDDPARRRVYAESRWAATPAALFTQRLRNRFALSARAVLTPGDQADAAYALQVDLDDFSQSFGAPGTSQVNLQLRASLIDLDNHRLVAQKNFSLQRTAPTPDAPGAVSALAAAAEQAANELVGWVSSVLKRRK